jgi:transposase
MDGKDSTAKTTVVSRRRYDLEFKQRLVRMSLVPGASAAKIALKHQINTNLLFKWRRLYLREISGTAAESVKLLPVTVSELTDEPQRRPVQTAKNARSPRADRVGAIEIVLPEGRILVKGGVQIELLRAVVQMVRSR